MGRKRKAFGRAHAIKKPRTGRGSFLSATTAAVFLFIFQVIALCFAFVVRYVITLCILLFTRTCIQVIADLGPGLMANELFALHIVLTSASFHNHNF
jgi:hypothetical protein